MSYQLVIYALSQGEMNISVILYLTSYSHAYAETILVRNPIHLDTDAEVHLRPIQVDKLDGLIAQQGVLGQRQRNEYADYLVFG